MKAVDRHDAMCAGRSAAAQKKGKGRTSMKRPIATLAFAAIFTSAAAASDYVSDPAIDAILHAVEEEWNATYGGNGADVEAALPDVSESATSGSVTVTLKLDHATYALDLGKLKFAALNPIEQTKCAFTCTVNEIEWSADGTVKVQTPNNTYTYDCNNIAMGVKNFTVSGKIAVGESGAAFSSIVVDVDSSDYYFTLPCVSGPEEAAAIEAALAQALPSNYRNMLIAQMKKPDSRFTSVSKSRTLQNMKKEMRALVDEQ